jgi:tetratricopeptide (TPR) repeat protein
VRQIIALSVILLVFLPQTATICSGQVVAADRQRENAIALELQGKVTEAESAWRAVLKIHPSSAEAYAHLGFLEARQEHFAEALPLYRKAFAMDPRMPGLRLNLGLSLFKSGALKDATQIFLPLLKQGTQSPSEIQRLNILVGMSHYGLGEYAAAVPYLKEAATKDQQSLWLRLALAHSCMGSKQFPCVLDVYREIVALDAESAEADMLAGEALDEMKNHAGAIEQFQAAARADPKMPDVHFVLGYLLWTQNQLEEAAKAFKDELANAPDHPRALIYLADIYIKSNDNAAAQSLLEKAIGIDPGIALGHLDLGIVYASIGRNTEAQREMKIAEVQSPNDENVHWRMGRFYRSIGKNDEARIEFEKTRSVHKSADETVFSELRRARARQKSSDLIPDAPVQ